MVNNSNQYKDYDDRLLLEKIQKEDEEAFEILFKKYYLQLTRFAWRYVNSKAIAEELVQDVFSVFWEERYELSLEGSIRSFLYKLIKNKSLNHIKHQKVKEKYDSGWMEKKNNPTIEFKDQVREKQLKNAIASAIEELPARSKMTFKLHRFDGLTYQEIAEVMDISVKTVESQMSRTLKILRDKLSYLLPFLIVSLLVG